MDDVTKLALRKVHDQFARALVDLQMRYDLSLFWNDTSLPILTRIAKHIGPMDGLACGQKIERVRNYVALARDRTGSRDAYESPPTQIASILRAIYTYMNGGSEPVYMFCQAAVLAMACLLHYYGITARPASILSTTSDSTRTSIKSHALLEVYNSDEGRWELHDPILDLAYGIKNADGQARHLSLFDFFSAPDGVFQPLCVADQFEVRQPCEYALSVSTTHFNLFRHVVVSQYLTDKAVGLINIDRVDMAHRFAQMEHKNIVEFLNTIYGVPTLIAWQKGHMSTLPPLKEGVAFAPSPQAGVAP